MKVATLSGAIDTGKITPSTVINDPGWISVGGATIHDWDLANHGDITMTRVLEASLNVGAVKAMQAEGRDSYFHYLQQFGFARPTGVDVAGEAAMRVPPLSQWSDTQLATASFGQGVAATMVQMCAAVNVIANHGVWVQPHVVARIGDQPVGPMATHQVVSAQTAAEMNGMMRSVVQHGSGYLARIPGFELDETGKTGTSQIPENGVYSKDHVWASYTGFLPAQNPRFTMLVVVRQPNNGSSDGNEGYRVSAPIWKQIAQQIILEDHITPGSLPPV